MIPAGIGLPLNVAVPDTSYSFSPDPHPAARTRKTRTLGRPTQPASFVLVVTVHLGAVAAGEGAVSGHVDGFPDEPHRAIAEGEVRPAGVHAPHRDFVELGDQGGPERRVDGVRRVPGPDAVATTRFPAPQPAPVAGAELGGEPRHFPDHDRVR